MEKNLPDLKEESTSRDVSHHKEEGFSRIIEDEKDQEKMWKFSQPVYTLLILKTTQQKLWTCTPANYQPKM